MAYNNLKDLVNLDIRSIFVNHHIPFSYWLRTEEATNRRRSPFPFRCWNDSTSTMYPRSPGIVYKCRTDVL